MIRSDEQVSRVQRLVRSDDWQFAVRPALQSRLALAMRKCALSRELSPEQWRAEQERCRLLEQLLSDPESLLTLPSDE